MQRAAAAAINSETECVKCVVEYRGGVTGVWENWCYVHVYARIIIRSWTFLLENIVAKGYHNVLWKEHFKPILLCVDNYVLEAEEKRLQHHCTISYRHFFTDYKTVLMQQDYVIGPSSIKQQIPLGKKLVMHSSCFPKLTLACHPTVCAAETSVFGEVPSFDTTKGIHIPDKVWSCSLL